jgi:Leucine-rich repeat (LRR) protein
MTDEHTTALKTRWNDITPGRLLVVLLAVELVLYFSERSYPKGWAVLFATASVVATTLYLLVRFAWALLFHRPFQYSIRSMLIFTAIIAIAGGWMAQRIREAAQQEQALGLCGQGIWKETDNLTPSCLRHLFGGHFFLELNDAFECDYCESNATDADLEYVKRFKRLRKLTIRGNPAITDAALERLKDLKQLTHLYLLETNITDAGMKQIEAFDNLQELWLCNTRVTGAGLKYLAGLKQLRSLRFEKGAITDEGLDAIKKLTQLEGLSIENAGITDARLDFLDGMKKLRVLDLSENRITDSGLQNFQEMKQLKALYLYNTNITDAGLKHLSEYDNLKTLGLLGTKVTDAGLKYLSKMTQLEAVILSGTNTSFAAKEKLMKELPTTDIGF